jgi:hypothetical protein
LLMIMYAQSVCKELQKGSLEVSAGTVPHRFSFSGNIS